MNYTGALLDGLAERQAKEKQAAEAKAIAEAQAEQARFDGVSKSVADAAKLLVSFLQTHQTTVKNFPDSIHTPDAKEVVEAVKHLETALKPVSADNTELLASLKAIQAAIKDQPALDTVAVNNLDGLQATMEKIADGQSQLLAAIKAIEVAPKVEVPAPVVNTPKIDLAPLKSGLSAVQEAIKDQGHFTNTHVATDPLVEYVPTDIDDAGTVQYFGYIDRTGTWYIQKFNTSTSPKTLRFCFGNSGYAAAWTARASQTYGYWGQ